MTKEGKKKKRKRKKKKEKLKPYTLGIKRHRMPFCPSYNTCNSLTATKFRV